MPIVNCGELIVWSKAVAPLASKICTLKLPLLDAVSNLTAPLKNEELCIVSIAAFGKFR